VTQYIPRTLAQIEAMHYNAWDETAEDVKTWVTGLIAPSFEEGVVTISDNGMGMFMVVATTPAENEEDDDIVEVLITVNTDQYVFLDEDGFHVLNQSVFDALYKQVPAA
jgi:hypothetical protein